jgi:hypothetical protein
MVEINIQTFDNLEVQTDPDLFAYDGGYEAAERLAQGFHANTATAWGLQSITETALRGMQVLGADDKLLSADEANKVYGVEGKLSFNSPIPESVASLRYNKYIDNTARREILDSAARDNHGLEWFLQGSLENFVPAALEAGLLGFGAAATIGKASKFILASNRLAKFAPAVNAAVLNPFTLGGGMTTGIVRGVVGEGLLELTIQSAIRDQAERNGYEYNDLIGLASIVLGGIGGGVAGGVIGAGAIGRMKPLFDFLDGEKVLKDAVEGGVISIDAVAASTAKMMADLELGKVTDPDIIKAILRVNQAETTRGYLSGLIDNGDFSGIISKTEFEALDDLALAERRDELIFKAFVKKNNIGSEIFNRLEGVGQRLNEVQKQLEQLEARQILSPDTDLSKSIDELRVQEDELIKAQNSEFLSIVDKAFLKAKEEGFDLSKAMISDFRLIKGTGKEIVERNFENSVYDRIFKALTEGKLNIESFKKNFDVPPNSSFLRAYTSKDGLLQLDQLIDEAIQDSGLDPLTIRDEIIDLFRENSESPLSYFKRKEVQRLKNVLADNVIPRDSEIAKEIDDLVIKLEDPNIKPKEATQIQERIAELSEMYVGEGRATTIFNSVDEMTLDNYMDMYKALSGKIKALNPNTKDFFNLDVDTQADIANLFRLINPNTNDFKFKGLLNLSDEEIQAAYNKLIFGKQNLKSMTMEEAQEALKASFKEAEGAAELAASLSKETDEINASLESLKNAEDADLETLLKNTNVSEEEQIRILKEVSEDPDYQALTKEEGEVKGLVEGLNCLMRAK